MSGSRWNALATVPTFLRLLGLVYFIAFISFGIQATGLIGSHGILPAADYFRAVREGLGRAGYWEVPSVLWLNTGDSALRATWIVGAALSLIALAGFSQRLALAGCLVLWISIMSAGQDFLSFQWDILLSEAGFLAIFADCSPIRVSLFRWLLFRLMFFSGAVKLLSGDPTWRDLSALSYHYETQPLPTPLAWYLHQFPLVFQKASTALMFGAELIAPFLFFGPRRVRYAGACSIIALQLLILLTGNYTFFNLLTILLTLFLFIEWVPTPQRAALRRGISIGLAALVGAVSSVLFLTLFAPPPPVAAAILRVVAPLRILNSYGLFAVMTTARQEIVIEGSRDGVAWLAYEFPYKPGDLRRAPPIVAPHQPRLDWQMWFAALGTYQVNRWFTNLMIRIMQGEPAVLRLLKYNPFPDSPPKYVRARLYLYHFTRYGDAAWWNREERGLYFPTVSLQ